VLVVPLTVLLVRLRRPRLRLRRNVRSMVVSTRNAREPVSILVRLRERTRRLKRLMLRQSEKLKRELLVRPRVTSVRS